MALKKQASTPLLEDSQFLEISAADITFLNLVGFVCALISLSVASRRVALHHRHVYPQHHKNEEAFKVDKFQTHAPIKGNLIDVLIDHLRWFPSDPGSLGRCTEESGPA